MGVCDHEIVEFCMRTDSPIDLKTPGASSDRFWRSVPLSANLLLSSSRMHGKRRVGGRQAMGSRAADGSKLLRVVSRDHGLVRHTSMGRGRSSIAIQTCSDAKPPSLSSKFADRLGKGY